MIDWICRDRHLTVGQHPLIMGILNVTPDSFSDGGQFADASDAVAHALRMIKDGADIIDVGGASTRPGADAVSVDEEIARVVPVIKTLRETTDAILSVDTMKADVAEAALEAGVNVVIYANQLLRSAFPAMKKTAESILQHERCHEASEYCLGIKEIITLIPDSV